MEAFKKIISKVIPLDRANVDTDAIIPKQFLKKIERTGFGVHLFHDWRYLDDEGTKENPDFILNKSNLQDAQVLIAQDNFGCGSSREHAPWALADWGFRVLIAPSFADIFYNNSIKNGILPIILDQKIVDELFDQLQKNPLEQMTVDLESKQATFNGRSYTFEMGDFQRESLLKGLDDIGWTLQFSDQIASYEEKAQQNYPWLWA